MLCNENKLITNYGITYFTGSKLGPLKLEYCLFPLNHTSVFIGIQIQNNAFPENFLEYKF